MPPASSAKTIWATGTRPADRPRLRRVLRPLYHLNASEDPEQRDYPPAADFPDFLKKFGPRGVIHSFRAARDGTQKVEDTGPLTKKRMEIIDDDCAARSAEFIEAQHKAGKPGSCG